MFVLGYSFRRPEDNRAVYSAESGKPLRIGAPARLVCKWHSSFDDRHQTRSTGTANTYPTPRSVWMTRGALG
jgi:hypothetical protein